MVVVHYDISEFPCFKADKMHHEVIMYDENSDVINRISNIYDTEWNYISITGGDWNYIEPPDPEPVPEPTELEILRADVDYCLMILEEL